jgi:predicted transcriptional regulator
VSVIELLNLRHSVRLTPTEMSALRALAEEHDRDVSWEIRRAVRQYLQAQGMSDTGRHGPSPSSPAA